MAESNMNPKASANEKMSRVSHDLRNPLNSISMNAELVKLKLQQSGDPEQLATYLDRILQECKNCGAVLESSMKDGDE